MTSNYLIPKYCEICKINFAELAEFSEEIYWNHIFSHEEKDFLRESIEHEKLNNPVLARKCKCFFIYRLKTDNDFYSHFVGKAFNKPAPTEEIARVQEIIVDMMECIRIIPMKKEHFRKMFCDEFCDLNSDVENTKIQE